MNIDANKIIARLSKFIGDQQVTIALLQTQIDELKQKEQTKITEEKSDT